MMANACVHQVPHPLCGERYRVDFDAREAAIRMTKMAEVYHDRTQDFSGQIRTKLPFYLFKTEEEYLGAGGMRGTAGVFKIARVLGRNFPLVLLLLMIGALFWPTDHQDSEVGGAEARPDGFRPADPHP